MYELVDTVILKTYPLESDREYVFKISGDQAVIHTLSPRIYRKYLRGRLVETFRVADPAHVLTSMSALDPGSENTQLLVNGSDRLIPDLDGSRRYVLFDGIPLSDDQLLSLRRHRKGYILSINGRIVFSGGTERLHSVYFIGQDEMRRLWIYEENFSPENSLRRERTVSVIDSLGYVIGTLDLPRTAYSKIKIPYALSADGTFHALYSLADKLKLISFGLTDLHPSAIPDSIFNSSQYDDFRFDDPPPAIETLLDSSSGVQNDSTYHPSIFIPDSSSR